MLFKPLERLVKGGLGGLTRIYYIYIIAKVRFNIQLIDSIRTDSVSQGSTGHLKDRTNYNIRAKYLYTI